MQRSYRLSHYICSILRKSLFVTSVRSKSLLMDLDVLDDFTTQLMQKKTDKWENLKIKRQFPLAVQSEPVNKALLRCRLNRITMTGLNEIFEKFLDETDQQKLVTLLEECISYKICPSDMILTNVLSSFSQATNIDGINKVQELCSLSNPEFLKANSNFKHYIAEAIWLKGNVLKAIGIYEDVYQENPFLRRRIRLVLKYLISEAVLNRSEAVLVNLVNFSERLAKKNKDYFIMSCLWQTCFLSEWFSDQQVAFDLMESNRNLCRMVTPQIPLVVSLLLRHHRTGNVLKAIGIYEDVYQENPFLRRRIRLVLKYLISEAVLNRSEAVLVNLVNFSERLAKKNKDYFIMSCLWQTCFLSEWFSDQQVAFDLMESNRNLCRMVTPQIPLVVSLLLRHHRTDPIFRLLEVLLKYQMKMQISIVLIALFDYRFKQGDLKSCCEILSWSTKHQIMLPSIQHEKFLKLLLKEETVDNKERQTATPKYELKF
ncbi:hypothetical protein AMK59_3439 [Oryctes borbonicus]|uniref:Uncharacterized protein n=1 Tax=Oryctes borbonicus TaxID=1629725 RepID=A0A0T6B4M2_9SCAR|nr:hypothetical protein AMK59_3439 [Oryctes borbonicus]